PAALRRQLLRRRHRFGGARAHGDGLRIVERALSGPQGGRTPHHHLPAQPALLRGVVQEERPPRGVSSPLVRARRNHPPPQADRLLPPGGGVSDAPGLAGRQGAAPPPPPPAGLDPAVALVLFNDLSGGG